MNIDLHNSDRIKSKIVTLRGKPVILDSDLSSLYQVEIKRLNEQFKRNQARFPADFAFQLTSEEWDSLRSQNATLKSKQGQHRKYLPFAFTEYGTLMLASVLNSTIAIEINQIIIRSFVELRHQINQNSDYQLLLQTVKLIESRMSALESHQLVDSTVLSSKMTQLSQDVKRFSETLEEFQNNSLIIKRPIDGPSLG